MKLFLLFQLMVITFASATSEKEYASLYAENLIEKFDEELDLKLIENNHHSMLETETYSRILATKAYMDLRNNQKESGLLSFNENEYKKTVDKINKSAKKIFADLKTIKSRSSVIYPSASRAGNITGNTFPRNVWSLTYDDGPHPTRTKMIVDDLYTNDIKATFFILTGLALKRTNILNYTIDSGMEIAAHTYTHLNLASSARTQQELDYEIGTAKRDLEELAQRKMKFFRLPYGAGVRKASLREHIAKENLIHVFWNVDTLDWKDKDPKSILARALKQMALTPKKSGIILFHDIHSQSVKASRLLIDEMKSRDLTICTLGEVVNFLNNDPQSCL